MQRPNLQFNYYYPFYTKKDTEKKSAPFYMNETMMHLSDRRGILISIAYRRQRLSELTLETVNSRDKLTEAQRTCKYLSYVDFADIIDNTYIQITRALQKLRKAKPYLMEDWSATWFKYNRSTRFEFEAERISLYFGNESPINQASIHEIPQEQFEKQLNTVWNLFIKYFSCPNTLKKSAYEPTPKN